MFNVQMKVLDSRIKSEDVAYGSDGAAGLDMRACLQEVLELKPGEVQLVSTGLSVFIGDRGVTGLLLPRSGTGHKKGLVLGNLVGLIDSDYQGDLKMSLWNRSQQVIRIEPMERVAQLVFVPVMHPKVEWVETFKEVSARQEGGFGSTGTH